MDHPKIVFTDELRILSSPDRKRLLAACQQVSESAFEWLPHHAAQVEFILVNSHRIQSLNRQFRGKNKPTDVLSFPSDQNDLLGSIVIDFETANAQAREYQHSRLQEIFELYVHGLFHLLGFDHENRQDAEIMRSYELLWTKGVRL